MNQNFNPILLSGREYDEMVTKKREATQIKYDLKTLADDTVQSSRVISNDNRAVYFGKAEEVMSYNSQDGFEFAELHDEVLRNNREKSV